MPTDIYTSIIEEIINSSNIIRENIVWRIISIFIFSFLLSFIIDLYNLKPLTASANNTGINIMFCNNKLNITKANPFDNPIIDIQAEIVYPKQKPLYNVIPNTIGIPITVVPKNHIINVNNTFCFILFFKSSIYYFTKKENFFVKLT